MTSRFPDEQKIISAWRKGYDTGLSARALVTYLNTGMLEITIDGGAYPGDPDDLGRCIRALNKMPFLRERLRTAAAIGPVWAGYVRHWALLEELYRREEPSGTAPQCYAAMAAIVQAIAAGIDPTAEVVERAIAEDAADRANEPPPSVSPNAGATPSTTVPFIVPDADRESISGKSVDFVTAVLGALQKEYGTPCARCKKMRQVCLFGRYGPTPDPSLCDPCARA